MSLSSPELLIFLRNSRWRPPPSWIFSLCEFGHSMCWQCGICALYQIGWKYMHWSLRSTHLCFRRSFDDVTRINFRFRLLVTCSSAHGSDASFHKIWCRYLYPMRSYWHFAEIKDGGRRHLGFVGGSHGTTHEGTLVVRTPCKNFVMIGSVGLVSSYKGLNFLSYRLEFFLNRPQKFRFLGSFTPKI